MIDPFSLFQIVAWGILFMKHRQKTECFFCTKPARGWWNFNEVTIMEFVPLISIPQSCICKILAASDSIISDAIQILIYCSFVILVRVHKMHKA